MSPHIAIDQAAIKAFCERHHVARLTVFGSVLRDDCHADSESMCWWTGVSREDSTA